MGWISWQLDAPTWAWIAWLIWFFAWESWALVSGVYMATLTAHLRPIFIEHPTTWFLALGLWLWLGVHMLAPALEEWLVTVIKGTA